MSERRKQQVETTHESVELISIVTLAVHDWYTVAPQYRTRRRLLELINDAMKEKGFQ